MSFEQLFPRPLTTVDVVPLTLRENALCVGTMVRENEPMKGRAALPGGFVRPEEDSDVEATALRIMRDKIGCVPEYLEQLAVFSGPKRDPREWSLSVAFVAVLLKPDDTELTYALAGDLNGLPFDHNHIVREALAKVRNRAGYSSLPLNFLEEPFTLPEAHGVYETVLDTRLDKAAFRRKLLETDFLEDTGKLSKPTGRVARPAKLYRRARGLRFTPRNFASRL